MKRDKTNWDKKLELKEQVKGSRPDFTPVKLLLARHIELFEQEGLKPVDEMEIGFRVVDYFFPEKQHTDAIFLLQQKYSARPKRFSFRVLSKFLEFLICESVNRILVFDLRKGVIEKIDKKKMPKYKTPFIIKDPFIRGFNHGDTLLEENVPKLISTFKVIHEAVISGNSQSLFKEAEQDFEEELKREE